MTKHINHPNSLLSCSVPVCSYVCIWIISLPSLLCLLHFALPCIRWCVVMLLRETLQPTMPWHWQSVSQCRCKAMRGERDRDSRNTEPFFKMLSWITFRGFYILDSAIVKVLSFTGNHSDCGKTCTNITPKVTLSKKHSLFRNITTTELVLEE